MAGKSQSTSTEKMDKKVERICNYVIATGVIVGLLLISYFLFVYKMPYYNKYVHVQKVDTINKIVTFEDMNGELWEMPTDDPEQFGWFDFYYLKMHDNYTEDFHDDKIVSYKRS